MSNDKGSVGRPRVYDEAPLTERITVPLTKSQRRELDNVAKIFSVPVSALIRDLVMEDIQEIRKDLAKSNVP